MIPKTMKAAVVRNFGEPLKIEEMPIRSPGQHEILVKVVACGVYHTEPARCPGRLARKTKL